MWTIQEKRNANAKLNHAVKTNKIQKPDKCSKCNKPVQGHYLHGHHKDYDKPLDVDWLCYKCHGIERLIDNWSNDLVKTNQLVVNGTQYFLPILEETDFVNSGLLTLNVTDEHEYWPEKIDWQSHLKCLTYRQKEIIKLRFGFGNGYIYTLEEVAKIFKVSRECIRQIEKAALERLKREMAA